MSKVKRFVLPIIVGSIILVIVAAAIFADFVAPHSPTAISLPGKLLPPFWADGGSMKYPMGTDELGRDILSRIIFGARYSLAIAFLVIFIGGALGTSLGLVAGFSGGRVDSLIMRVADGAVALPFFLVALILAALWGPGFHNVVISLVLTIWARYARVIRGEVLSLRERDFVAEARVIGCSTSTILTRHILPNVFATLMVLVSLQVGWAIILEAALSFLGAGIAPPAPAWGLMVASGKDYLVEAWWLSFFPGLAIMILVLSLNLLGDWLRDYLDPRLREI
jgi:peptide/nickel transport system permease protein